MTAAATTGPASGPRPASSIPATSGIPLAHSSFSNRRLQGMPDAYLSSNDAGCKAFFCLWIRDRKQIIFLLVKGVQGSSVRQLPHFVEKSNRAGLSGRVLPYHEIGF